LLSIATQIPSFGQDTSDRYGRPLKPSRLVTVHAAVPAVGLREVITLAYSTATQRLLLGQ
jgi:HD-like signal output (HDOD) protein